MGPVSIWFLVVAVWALCHFWFLPLSKDRWQVSDMRAKVARAGALVVLEKIRDLSAIAAVMLCAVIALVWLSGFVATTSSVVPQAVIHAAASVHDAVKSIGEQYGSVLGVVALLGAVASLYLMAKSARQRVAQAWATKAQEMHTRLREDAEAFEAARKEVELQPIFARLDGVIERLAAADRGDEGAALSPAERTQLQNEASELFSILAIESARKDLKFEEAVATPTAEETNLPKTRWHRLLRVISSDRFAKDLGFVKKPLSYVATGLVVLSLVGWTAEPLADSLHLAVNNLRINVVDQQAKRELEQVVSKSAAAEPDDAADSAAVPATVVPQTAQSAARLVARVAVEQMTRSGVLDRAVQARSSALSEGEFVRATLNDQHLEVPADADTATKVRREAAESVGQKLDDSPGIKAAKEQIAHELEPSLQRLQRENPGRFQKWASTLEARYATPMAPLDAQGKILGRMLDEAFGAVDVKPTTELGKQSQKLVKDLGKESVKTWAQSWAKTWASDAIIESVRHDVSTATAREFAFETSAKSRRFIDDLVAAEGRGWVAGAEAQRDAKVARAVADKVATLHEPEMRPALREQMGGYEQLFPREAPTGPVGPTAEHAKGRAVARTAPQVPTGTFAQSRATSFHLASHSFRVRGVLIGRDAPTSGLDVSQIRWTVRPADRNTNTTLALAVLQKGRWIDLGSFDAGVVNQALRYAADRRVVATTITAGDGKAVQRLTYLHPVLADTPLGCRVVEADRFIDTFSFPHGSERQPTSLATLGIDRIQMGRWMRVVALTEAVAQIPESAVCPRAEIDTVATRQKLGSVRFSPGLSSQLSAFMSAEEKKLPGSTRLLRMAQACEQSPTAEIGACLCDKAKGRGLPPDYWYPEDHTSQFRERNVAEGADWSWMQRSGSRLENVDLWVHTTFSLRNSRTDNGAVDESTARAVDFPVESLETLRKQVAESLPGYLRTRLNSPSYDDFMLPLEDFILLQRFFRSALAGGLGKDFPMGQLLRLEKETRPFVARQPTIRWEPAESEEALEEVLQQADPVARQSYVSWRDDSTLRQMTRRPTCDRVSK